MRAGAEKRLAWLGSIILCPFLACSVHGWPVIGSPVLRDTCRLSEQLGKQEEVSGPLLVVGTYQLYAWELGVTVKMCQKNIELEAKAV